MLIPFPALKRRGVERVGKHEWRALDDDPLFIYFTQLPFFGYLALDLRSTGGRLLDPRFYVDSGDGFQPNEEIAPRAGRDAVFAVDLKSFGKVRRLRFDPASLPTTFSLRAYLAGDERDVNALFGARLREAAERGDPLPHTQIVTGEKRVAAPRGERRRRKRSRDPRGEFDQIIALAERRYGGVAPEWRGPPLISFVCPVYDTPAAYLEQLLNSFRIQRAGAFELILSDDGSTRPETLAFLERVAERANFVRLARGENGGIPVATNRGLEIAVGEWVGLIDHDDALAPFAVDHLLDAIESHPAAAFIYTDEIVADASLRPRGFFFKPAFDPVLLSGVNYINHLSLYRRDRLASIGGLRQGFDGSQDYDLLLRYCAGLREEQVFHLPYPAYLWRRDGASFSATFLDRSTQNARRALAERFGTAIDPALDETLHRPRFDLVAKDWPLISVVIPSRNAFPLISRLLDDLTRRTDYERLEIIIADNGSTDPRVLDLYERMRRERPGFIADIVEGPFDFAGQCNRGLALARGDAVLLLNNDIEAMEPNWLKEMASCLAYPRAGVVGARLLYPDGALQHAGVIVGLGGVAGHWHCGQPANAPGPMSRLTVRNGLCAVTGACMLISRACLDATGLLDAENFSVAYNDVDFCMRAREAGFRTVWTPFATLLHHESASRGSDETDANIERFRGEQQRLREKYALAGFVDPAFSPYLNRHHHLPQTVDLSELPPARLFWPPEAAESAAAQESSLANSQFR